MRQNLYALIVGIDEYPSTSSGSSLKGCVNDAKAVTEFLNQRVKREEKNLKIQTLFNKQATRQAIINGFREHLCQASSNDVVVFYYSGHGSQEEAAKEFWYGEPDHLHETLVCWDSRLERGMDLADKELAKLIAEVAEQNPHLVVILDCCHSGGNAHKQNHHSARSTSSQENFAVRWISKRPKRALKDFLFSASDIDRLSQGKYILLAACRDNEQAREYYAKKQHRGLFSYFLMDTLQQTNGDVTYRDLFKRTNALVTSISSFQSPRIVESNFNYLDQPFLGGVVTQRSFYFTVTYHRTNGWVIDGGAVHGISSPTREETTKLAIFSFTTPIENLCQLSQAIVLAEVAEVLPYLSKINIISDTKESLDSQLTYKAVMISLPLTPLGIYLSGENTGIALIRQAIGKASCTERASLYVAEVSELQQAEFCVVATDERYSITQPLNERPLITSINRYTPESALQVIRALEHIARWRNIATLGSPATSRILPNAIKLQIYRDDLEIKDSSQIELKYEYKNDKWQPPALKIKLTNNYDRPLYCVLLNLTQRYAVNAIFLGGGIWLEPKQEVWALEGNPLYVTIPKELWEQGITEYKDILKLIVSTSEFDATLLEQDRLEAATTRSANDTLRSTFDRLMKRNQTRVLIASADEEDEEDIWDDWMTNEITISTVRPQFDRSVINYQNIHASAEVESLSDRANQDTAKSNKNHFSINLFPIVAIALIGVIMLSLLIWQQLQPKKQKRIPETTMHLTSTN